MSDTTKIAAGSITTGGTNPPVVLPDNKTETGSIGITAVKIEVPKEYTHFGKKVKVGSRKIQLTRIEKFSLLPKGGPAKTLRDEVTLKIGSEWKRGTRDIIRGLSQEEEAHYLPRIIGMKLDSEKWEDAKKEFWANYSVLVPNNEDGIELEVGFTLEKNIVVPISLEDYMRYNFAIQSTVVRKEGEDNILPSHIIQIVDKGRIMEQKESEFAIRKEVSIHFQKLIRSSDPQERAKINWILETLGGPNGDGMVISGLSELQKEMALEDFMNKNVTKFKDIIEDKNLQLKALIRKAISRGSEHLSLEGGIYWINKNKPIGDLTALLGYYSDPNNGRDRQILVEGTKD